jgi:hypothetical protein
MSTAPRIDRLERNLVINGGFDFWQRVAGNTYTNTSAAPGVVYTADRFYTYAAGVTAKSYTIARSTDVPTIAQVGSTVGFSYKFTCTAALAFAATDDLAPIAYKIEGYDYQRIHGKTFTVSFWVKASVAGIYAANFLGASATRSYVTSFVITTAGVWQYVSITVTAESTANYLFTNGIGLEINFGCFEGSVQQTSTLNSWQNGIYKSFASAVNLLGIAGQSFQVTAVSVVEGSSGVSAGSFARAGGTIVQEFQFCQRYYEKSVPLETAPSTIFTNGRLHFDYSPLATWGSAVSYKVSKRAVPTVVLWNPDTGGTGVQVAAGTIPAASRFTDVNYFEAFYSAGTTYAYVAFHYSADAEL